MVSGITSSLRKKHLLHRGNLIYESLLKEPGRSASAGRVMKIPKTISPMASAAETMSNRATFVAFIE